MIINGLYYSEEHEWVKVEGNIATIGITDYAQDALGDIVFVELPNVDDEFTQMDEIGVLESVKTVSNIYIPLSGRIVEVNDAAIEDPALINSSPYDEGWLVKIEMYEKSELDDLNSSEEYEEMLGEEE
ncbi:MAG: glycine cleavage system protein GcvH [Candidatus Margulisbacteria bacterium]|nr:glycine cleavage system protein GcvH [Candidatus Margulisiibacteriota bacterium]